MTAAEAIQWLADPANQESRDTEPGEVLYQAVLAAIKRRNPCYTEPTTTERTSVADWLDEGDYQGTETVESLAAEWEAGCSGA